MALFHNAQELPVLVWWQRTSLRLRQTVIRWASKGQPLLFTSRGMEPIEGLERVVEWQLTPDDKGVVKEVACIETWRDRVTKEIVVRSPDVLLLKPPPAVGTEQASFGG